MKADRCAPFCLAGVVVQGAGSSDAYVTSFFLQFSPDGVGWHDYHDVSSEGATLGPKVHEVSMLQG